MDLDKFKEEKIRQLLNILEDFLRKMKIALCLPLFLKCNRLESIMDENEIKMLRKIAYYFKYKSKYGNSMWQNDQEEPEYTEMLNSLLSILQNLDFKSNIYSVIGDYVLYDKEVSHYITAIDLYNQYVKEEMERSPILKIERQTELNNAIVSIKHYETENLSLDHQLETKKNYHKHNIVRLVNEIEVWESTTAQLKLNCTEELEKIVYLSEVEMVKTYKIIQDKITKIDQEILLQEYKYDKSLEDDLKKELYFEKLSAEADNRHTRAKALYDKKIEHKEQIRQNLLEDLKNLSLKIQELNESFTLQKKQYSKIREEIDKITQQQFMIRLELFARNRAARIIQRTWKKYKERMALKKKKKYRKRK